MRHLPQRWAYPVLGVVLALAAPLGLLVVRSVIDNALLAPAWLAEEWQRNQVVYLYLLVTTPIMLGLVGWLVGRTQYSLAIYSMSDPLTDLPNRRYFEARLAEEIARSQRTGEPLSLVMLDLDRLKEINDSGGHDAGDRALRAVSDAVRGSIRRTDVGARIAGDEFVVLAPGTRARDVVELATRIREALRSTAPGRTLSVGIADLTSTELDTPQALLEAADHALYEAKQGGRDRVVVAAPVESSRPRASGAVRRRDPGAANQNGGGGASGPTGGGEQSSAA